MKRLSFLTISVMLLMLLASCSKNQSSKLVPEDAVVIGERSNQMLMSLPIRTATTFAANSDPIPVIESILKAKPDAKLPELKEGENETEAESDDEEP